jgi:hypothetical protein
VSARTLQLWVERLTLDPAAWTAGHALQLLLGKDSPARVGRADLWELTADAEGADVARRFEEWMRASNLFMNPGRDRAQLLAGAPADAAEGTGHVVACERGATDSRAHAITVGHALGGRWSVRRGTVWSLAWPAERKDDVPALLERAAWARRRNSGLLVNAESQDARLFVATWDCPALPAPAPAKPAAAPTPPAAGGNDGQVA